MQKSEKSENNRLAWFNRLAKIAPFSWLIYAVSRWWLRGKLKKDEDYDTNSPLNETVPPEIISKDEIYHLKKIVESVVEDLGYVAAFLAPYEQGDVLPIRAFYIHPKVISPERLRSLEKEVSELVGQKLSLSDPHIARVYRYKEEYKANLSIRAVEAGKPIRDDNLFALFTPIVPEVGRPVLKAIQDALGVKQVVAVPFTIEYEHEEEAPNSILKRPMREVVGNLFAVKTSPISDQDINILKAFGYQAAAALQQNYHESRRQITQQLVLNVQRNLQNRKQTFEEIVNAIVDNLEYVGAAIFLLDGLGNLRLNTYCLDKVSTAGKALADWRLEFSKLAEHYTEQNDLRVGEFNIYNEHNSKNLGYETISEKNFTTSRSLYSLARPMLSATSRQRVEEVQASLGINSVLAIPLFSVSPSPNIPSLDNVMGVMYVASRSRGFTPREVEILKTIGEQVANTQVFALSEQRRRTALTYARRAVNMNASIHTLNGHLGVVRSAFYFMNDLNDEDKEKHNFALEQINRAKERIQQAAELMGTLDQVFIDNTAREVSVSTCVNRAVEKLDMELKSCKTRVTIEREPNLPPIFAFQEMLVEIFRVFIMRAMGAIIRLEREGLIQIQIRMLEAEKMLEVLIKDNGLTIKADQLAHVFEIDEDNKNSSLGFGLFWANDYILEMGGKITVESIPKLGTSFKITIPIRQNPASGD